MMILQLRGDKVIVQGTQLVSRKNSNPNGFVPVIIFPTTTLHWLSESPVFMHTLCINTKLESVAGSFVRILPLWWSLASSLFFAQGLVILLFSLNQGLYFCSNKTSWAGLPNAVIPAYDSSLSLLELNILKVGQSLPWAFVLSFLDTFAS